MLKHVILWTLKPELTEEEKIAVRRGAEEAVEEVSEAVEEVIEEVSECCEEKKEEPEE